MTAEKNQHTQPKLVGLSLKRREDPRLLMGKGTYVDDIRLPGMCYAAFVRSPYAHARITRIESQDAIRHPAVLDVVTGQDAARSMPSWMKYPGLRNVERYSLAVGKVRHVGEPVAAVVASDRYAAADAAELVNVEYEPLPAVVDAEEALRPGSPLLYEDWGDNVLLFRRFSGGNVEAAFREADFVFKERIRSHRYTATPIENRGILAKYEHADGSLTVWASTQFPHVLRTFLSQVLETPEHKITVIAPNVGGGFGPKSNVFPDEIATCLLSVRLGKPVKWIEERREHLMACAHAREQVHYAEAAFTKDGIILGVRDKAIADFGVYGPFWTESQPAMLSVTALPGPYRIRNYSYELYCAVTNKAPYGPHRGFGRPIGALVTERMIDIAASELGIDPADIRRKNVITPEEMPYKAITGVIYDSGNYPEALDRALALSKYESLRKKQAELRKEGRHVGVGMGMYVEYTAPNSDRLANALGWAVGGYESATIKVDPSGKITVFLGGADQGQGHETIFAQVVADELGVPFEDAVIVEGDTGKCPYGFGAWASRLTVTSGGACITAARKLRNKILEIAGHILEADPEELQITRGTISVRDLPSRAISLAEVATAALRTPTKLPPGMEPGLEVTVQFEPTVPTTCSYAVHVAVVEVDVETGEIKILGYYVVDDCGTVVNPMSVHGQVHGAVAHGIGGTLFEELVYDKDGQLLTTTFMDYLIPTSREIPDIEISHMETPSLLPGGFKGMGEGGSIGAPATICNAVADALAPLGVKITETPLSQERVLKLVKKAQRQTEH